MPVEGGGIHRIWYTGGRYAYASALLDGFTDYIFITIDMKDPAHPVEAGRYWLPGMNQAAGETAELGADQRYGLHHATVNGSTAYGAWRDAGLVMMDVGDPAKPTLKVHRNWSPPFGGGTHNCLALPDRQLMVVLDEAVLDHCEDGLKLIWLFDIREPANPVSISTFPTPAEADYVAKGGHFGPHNVYENRPRRPRQLRADLRDISECRHPRLRHQGPVPPGRGRRLRPARSPSASSTRARTAPGSSSPATCSSTERVSSTPTTTMAGSTSSSTRAEREDRMYYGVVEGTGFEAFDPRFGACLIGHARVERLWTGARWSEGPAWFAAGRYLVWSDIPNDRMLRYDDTDGSVSVFRQPSHNSNGNTVDAQGRLLTCEHGARRVTRTEHDGSITIIADRYGGKRLNSPNDLVVKSDGSVWFTDPSYGILCDYEGGAAECEQGACRVYRVDPAEPRGRDRRRRYFEKPNGIALPPDERHLSYIADTGVTHLEGGPKHIRRFPRLRWADVQVPRHSE